jgi:hypothetical protein
MGERRRLDGSVTIRCPQCGQGRRRDGRYDGPTMSVSPVSRPLSFRDEFMKESMKSCALLKVCAYWSTCNHVGEWRIVKAPAGEERGNPLGADLLTTIHHFRAWSPQGCLRI